MYHIYEVKIVANAKPENGIKYKKVYYKGIAICDKKRKKEQVAEKVRMDLQNELQEKNRDKEIQTKVVSVNIVGNDFIRKYEK